mmetsp:Transcript_572/g.1358  ORF Transcript_572/g.1358 Transcript_572/m.1358 type:complete len:105 (+) Transcript_572:65-379(+)
MGHNVEQLEIRQAWFSGTLLASGCTKKEGSWKDYLAPDSHRSGSILECTYRYRDTTLHRWLGCLWGRYRLVQVAWVTVQPSKIPTALHVVVHRLSTIEAIHCVG